MKIIIIALVSLMALSAHAYPTGSLIKSFFEKTSSELKVLKESRNYTTYEGKMSLLELNSVEPLAFGFHFYKSRRPLERLLVLTPNIEGVTLLEKRLAHRLSSAGFHVLIPIARSESFAFDNETSRKIERVFERAMAATLYMIDGIKEKVNFDDQQMGLIGASQGGIRSATLYGLDSRFKAIFTAVAGADLPSLYANTQIDALVDFRNSHMNGIKIDSVGGYEDYLRAQLTLDPSLISMNPHLDGVAMIIAEKDKIVPTKNQWKLWQSIKSAGFHPKTIVKNVGHVAGALMLVRYERVVLDWFSKKLNAPL